MRDCFTIFAAAVNVLAALKKDIDKKYANSVSAFRFLAYCTFARKYCQKEIDSLFVPAQDFYHYS